jgi:tetratricopeptide (TPR) repeat protein
MEGILKENPNYFDCLLYLGNAYTNIGRYEDGLRIDLKLAELRREDPIVRYNLACSYSLVGDVDSAISELETAVALGYKDIQHMEKDKDLEKLREDKRYRELIGRAKRSMAEVQDKDNK